MYCSAAESPVRQNTRLEILIVSLSVMLGPSCHAQRVAPLPEEARAVWDLDKAHRDMTATRERLCLNGLWRWQPADPESDQVPAGDWASFTIGKAAPEALLTYSRSFCAAHFW